MSKECSTERLKFLQKVLYSFLKDSLEIMNHNYDDGQLVAQSESLVESLILSIGADYNLDINNDEDVVRTAIKLLSEDQIILREDEIKAIINKINKSEISGL
jgi:hypothetical protein